LPDGPKTVGESFESGSALASWEKEIRVMRKALMFSGFERWMKNFNHAQIQARSKISATVKMVRWYLGN